jgi:16S rRNA processing protein RimM
MNWDDMAVVGRIARPHGIRGQVILNVETDFPEERFQPGIVMFVIRAAAIDRLLLTGVRFQNGRPVVSIDGIDSMTAAQQLAGLELRVPSEQLAPLPAGTYYRHDLVGCGVETVSGKSVGVVAEVEGPLHGSRLVVSAGTDEVLIPFVAEICLEIDTDRKRVVIAPPDGLLELNSEPQRSAQSRERPQGAQRRHTRRRRRRAKDSQITT